MSEEMLSITIRKERNKFSAAHMTVFSPTEKESLHGHNFSVAVKVTLKDKKFVPFSFLKELIQEGCDRWDEKLILAEKCPFFQVLEKTNETLKFSLCEKIYQVPADEVVLLPTENIVVESLAEQFFRHLWGRIDLKRKADFTTVEVSVEETMGQSGTFTFQN